MEQYIMKTIILAAGQGTRLKSTLPKVLHPILGKTILQYVVEATISANIKPENITVVVSPNSEAVKNMLLSKWENLNFAIQEQALGTGHAVKSGMGNIKDTDDVVILCGDTPLITGEFIKQLAEFRDKKPAEAVVTAVYFEDMRDFGRVFADEEGRFNEIVESKDITPEHPSTNWANTGVFLFKGSALRFGLEKMTNNNNQQEYYLTDVPKILKDEGKDVHVLMSRDEPSIFTGINTQVQLAEAVGFMRDRINKKHMLNGVRMIAPSTVYIDDTVEIAQGVVIYPNVILEGDCKIGADAIIGANSQIKDSSIGENAHIKHSVLDNAVVGANTNVGPFAYLRPGAVIGKSCRIGNFVEVKNANIGDKTNMAHLAYIGDADVGSGVNYSCGAITANYDGEKKHRTVIGDGAFIGCNSNLVAPVTIGDEAFIAAGSTITKDIEEGALGIARPQQVQKPNWKKPKK